MDIEMIRIFCDLVESQNFSRTAEKYGISQSAVSQQLAQLESTHNCQLLNRKKRPMKPTQAGKMFYQVCKDIITKYDKFKIDLSSLDRNIPTIKLRTILSIGLYSLQNYVKTFISQYPDVNLEIEYNSTEEIYDLLIKSVIDIGIVALPKKGKHFNIYPFENENLLLVCKPNNTLASKEAINIHQIREKDFISFNPNDPTRMLIDDILSQNDISVRTIMEFSNIETIKRAVEAGVGIAILPEKTVMTELSNGTLSAVSFSNEKFIRPTAIIVRKNAKLTQAGRYLLELFQKKN